METDFFILAVMALSITILGLSKGGFAGIGMVSTPLIAAVTDPITALGLILPIMLVQDAVAVFLYRYEFNAEILRRLIPGGALGVVLAYFTASLVPEWGVYILLGAVSVLFSIWQTIVVLRGIPQLEGPNRRDAFFGIFAGAASGFASAIAHAGSPPFQIYVMPKRLRKEVYVGTSVMFFASMNLMKLPSFLALGLFSPEHLRISAMFVPLAILASWAGAWLVRYINPRSFDLIVIAILFVIGTVLILQGIGFE